MPDNYLCRWVYTPADFFEAPIEFAGPGFIVTVNAGVVEAIVEPATFEANANFRATIRDALEHRFRARRWASLRGFSLLNGSWTGPLISGMRKHHAEVNLQGAGIVSCEFGAVGAFHVGADGELSLDLTQHYCQQRRGERLAVHGHDATVAAIVRGMDGATANGQDVLVRLYEVRDALTTKLGDATAKTLGIEATEWSSFGRLCNEPVTVESRHLGKATMPLSAAPADVIDKARRMAVGMLDRYLDHLDGIAPVSRSLLKP